MGFIGKYSKKLQDKKKAELDQVEEQNRLDALSYQTSIPGTNTAIKIPLSKAAPKHKGMLARAMEKDLKEQAEAERKEKEDIMKEALNDPLFQQQVTAI